MANVMKVVNTFMTGIVLIIVVVMTVNVLILANGQASNEEIVPSCLTLIGLGVFPVSTGAAILNIVTVFTQKIKTSTKVTNMILIIFIKVMMTYGMSFYLAARFGQIQPIIPETPNIWDSVSPEYVSVIVTISMLYGVALILLLFVDIATPFIYKPLPWKPESTTGNTTYQENTGKQSQEVKNLSKQNKSPFEIET